MYSYFHKMVVDYSQLLKNSIGGPRKGHFVLIFLSLLRTSSFVLLLLVHTARILVGTKILLNNEFGFTSAANPQFIIWVHYSLMRDFSSPRVRSGFAMWAFESGHIQTPLQRFSPARHFWLQLSCSQSPRTSWIRRIWCF